MSAECLYQPVWCDDPHDQNPGGFVTKSEFKFFLDVLSVYPIIFEWIGACSWRMVCEMCNWRPLHIYAVHFKRQHFIAIVNGNACLQRVSMLKSSVEGFCGVSLKIQRGCEVSIWNAVLCTFFILCFRRGISTSYSAGPGLKSLSRDRCHDWGLSWAFFSQFTVIK